MEYVSVCSQLKIKTLLWAVIIPTADVDLIRLWVSQSMIVIRSQASMLDNVIKII